jgi:hypothetical protein
MFKKDFYECLQKFPEKTLKIDQNYHPKIPAISTSYKGIYRSVSRGFYRTF